MRRSRAVGCTTAVFSRCALRHAGQGSPTAAARDASESKHPRTSQWRARFQSRNQNIPNFLTARGVTRRGEQNHKKIARRRLSSAPVPVSLGVRVAVRVATITNVAAPRAPSFGTPDAADGAARARVEGERFRHERVVLGAEAVWCGDFRRRRVESRDEARQTN